MCSALEDMRNIIESEIEIKDKMGQNCYGLLTLMTLVEEIQVMGNRMEDGLELKKEYNDLRKSYKNYKKKAKKLEDKIKDMKEKAKAMEEYLNDENEYEIEIEEE